MISKLHDIKQQYLPEKWEILFLQLLIIIGAFFGICKAMYISNMAIPFFVLASLSVATVWFLGARFLFPLYFALSITGPLNLPGVPVSLNQGVAGLLLFGFLKDLITHKVHFKPSAPIIIFILTFVYILATTLLQQPPDGEYPIQIAFYLIPTLFTTLLYTEEKKLKELLYFFILAGVACSILPGMFEALTGQNITTSGVTGTISRINGFSKDAILYAYLTVWLLPVALLLFIESKNFYSKCFTFSVTMGLLIVSLLTRNRQTLIVLGPMFLTFLIFIRYRYRPVLLATTLISGTAIAPYIMAKFAERFNITKNLLGDASYMFRHDKFMIALEMWKDHPWFGVGLDHFGLLWDHYRPIGLYIIEPSDQRRYYVDMGYTQIMVEFGVVGMLIFILLMTASAIHFIRIYRMSLKLKNCFYSNLLAALAALFVQFLLLNAISDCFLRLHTMLVFGIFFAASTAIRQQLSKQQPCESQS